MSSPRTLILAWGNPARRDDGLGPALAAGVAALAVPGVTTDCEYQLQVEDAAEVAKYDRVLFVDADRSGDHPFWIRRLPPATDGPAFTTHSVAPGMLLALSRELFESEPEAWLMGIRGYEFDAFGEGLSPAASANLAAALRFLGEAMRRGTLTESPHPIAV